MDGTFDPRRCHSRLYMISIRLFSFESTISFHFSFVAYLLHLFVLNDAPLPSFLACVLFLSLCVSFLFFVISPCTLYFQQMCQISSSLSFHFD